MHPAPTIIVFTVFSGFGFGLMAFLGIGWPAPAGWAAFFWWGLGYGCAAGGLIASTAHLGNPQRAWRAFSQWQSSWLSREGIAAVATLLLCAPVALSDWLELGWSRIPGVLGAVCALATIGTTSMIYTQMRSIPRWHHWTTPALFFGFALTGGAMAAGHVWLGAGLGLGLAGLMLVAFRLGDGQFARAGQTIGSATGLDRIGDATVFELPHTGGNYLLREMIHVVGRKHGTKLRIIAVGTVLAAAVLALVPFASPVAVGLHLAGALAARWLFFAQAEHVVGLYYGRR
jgi:DMSO reductase anchor subunit